jgi:hypothetical protein
MSSNSPVQSPADAINVSLRRIGYKLRVASLYDGSKAARSALDIYAQTRDEILRQNDWTFAERNIAMVLLKQAPAGGYIPPLVWSSVYPPLPWLFEYAYPNDCLKVRAVKPVPIFVPEFDPQPCVYGVENDNSLNPPAKVITCNVPNAVLVYTGQVTDPATWEADFVEEFCAALGRRLATGLVGGEVAKMEASDEAQAMNTAEMQEG